MKTLLRLIGSLLGALSFGALAAVWISRRRALALVHPSRRPIELAPTEFGIADFRHIEVRTRDGIYLRGWYVPPRGQDAAVVLVHGIGGNRAHMLAEAAVLNRHGYGMVMLDLRNSGESEGNITTLGYYEWLDVEAAVHFLLRESTVNPNRIALFGHSMGAATVIRAAARIPEVSAVVAQSPFTSIEENIADSVRILTGLPAFPFAPLVIFFGQRETGHDITELRPIDDLAAIAGKPIMFIHGEQDPLILVENSYRLFETAAEPKSLYIIPDGRHTRVWESEPEVFEQKILAFLSMAFGNSADE